ncbi:ribonuclease Z [Yeosuana aromativorans]|uniref:Ribonuclease Z n=1 Tax=Yeosuana aromativorans TaxID=288019 RepID=A0A8J3BGD4_9FLAO|nr:MBL fold metallo-hydrolase [Yeosuana aromativorans]GGK19561.1 ribonuclease Z [Yeosuana aromativorans]
MDKTNTKFSEKEHISKKRIETILFIFLLSLLFLKGNLQGQNTNPNTLKTRVVLLGTGTPGPNPNCSGPATAVVYGKRFFLFDAGSGVERMINAAKLPINGPEATFITHLHSDHTLGYPDLILTSWLMRRKKALNVYGPHGLQRMTNLLLDAYYEDIDIRTNHLEKEQAEYLKVNVKEIDSGIVYDSAGVKITAIPVLHGDWKEAYGFRIDTPDRSIVISGDTRPCDALVKASEGVDILVHEVYFGKGLKPEKRPGGEYWPEYCKSYHTSDIELGTIANKAKPKLLVLTHIIRNDATDSDLISGIREGGYKGKVIVGKDLDQF